MKTYTLPVKFLEDIVDINLPIKQRRELVTNRVKLGHSTLKGIPGAINSAKFIYNYAATIHHPQFMVTGIALDEYDKDLQLEITPTSVECDEYISEHGIDNIALGVVYVDNSTIGGCYFKSKSSLMWDEYVREHHRRLRGSPRGQDREVLDLTLISQEKLCATDGNHFIDCDHKVYKISNGNGLTPIDGFPIRLLQNALHWTYLTKDQVGDYKFYKVK